MVTLAPRWQTLHRQRLNVVPSRLSPLYLDACCLEDLKPLVSRPSNGANKSEHFHTRPATTWNCTINNVAVEWTFALSP